MDESLEFSDGQSDAASDSCGYEFAAPDELVDRGSSDAQDPRGLCEGDQQRVNLRRSRVRRAVDRRRFGRSPGWRSGWIGRSRSSIRSAGKLGGRFCQWRGPSHRRSELRRVTSSITSPNTTRSTDSASGRSGARRCRGRRLGPVRIVEPWKVDGINEREELLARLVSGTTHGFAPQRTWLPTPARASATLGDCYGRSGWSCGQRCRAARECRAGSKGSVVVLTGGYRACSVVLNLPCPA